MALAARTVQNRSGMSMRVEVADSKAAFCECVEGEWGRPCPACGRQLPPRPGPLRSWHAARALDPEVSEQARMALAKTQSFRSWHL